jgi:hypothetical protein
LPAAIAQAARDSGRNVFIVGIAGMATEENIGEFPHATAGIGEFGKIVRLLKDANCSDVTFAGRVTRPEFSKVKMDARGIMAFPKIVSAARRGDDALMRAILGYFERDGFRIVGSDEAAHELLVKQGPLGKLQPDDAARADIAKAMNVVRRLGSEDVGQAAVVAEGVVLAVEAAEGTDAMLDRVASLPATLRGSPSARRGVLVKAPKPGQERRVDLPVIGVRTIERAAAAGLSGIAVQAGSTLVIRRDAVSAAADKAGLFVVGFTEGDYPQ